MPRRARQLSESSIYHVMVRGNERKELFFDEEDRFRFIDTLYEKKKDDSFKLYAYCLMSNHVHMLIEEQKDCISRIMKRVNTGYAYYFNKKYNRIGHVFQDRYKSENIENDAYLLAVIRYIHNNPVKAGITSKPEEYQWSSYNSFCGKQKSAKDLIERKSILEMFSLDKEKAVSSFIEHANQANEDNFIEYNEAISVEKRIVGQNSAKVFVGEYLREKGLELGQLKIKENWPIRNELINELKAQSNLSIRQTAEVLGINKNIIHRI